MKNTCTLLSATAIAACIALMKTQPKLGSSNFKKIQKFLVDVKSCSIPGEAFALLVTEYSICLILAENPTLTPKQIIVLIDCETIQKNRRQILAKLLVNPANNQNSLKYLRSIQAGIGVQDYFTIE